MFSLLLAEPLVAPQVTHLVSQFPYLKRLKLLGFSLFLVGKTNYKKKLNPKTTRKPYKTQKKHPIKTQQKGPQKVT